MSATPLASTSTSRLQGLDCRQPSVCAEAKGSKERVSRPKRIRGRTGPASDGVGRGDEGEGGFARSGGGTRGARGRRGLGRALAQRFVAVGAVVRQVAVVGLALVADIGDVLTDGLPLLVQRLQALAQVEHAVDHLVLV